MAIQSQHKPEKKPVKQSKLYYPNVKAFLLKAINMYLEVTKQYEPFSDEWVICKEELFKYSADLELLEHGTHDERREVIEKYGRSIS
jgi:hypothetical protein